MSCSPFLSHDAFPKAETISSCEKLPMPGQYGSTQGCDVKLESVWDTEIHCAVRAGDEADNWSQVSNIVSRILPPRPTTTTPVPVTSDLNLETKEILELIRRGHIHNITSIKNIQVRPDGSKEACVYILFSGYS